MRFFCNSLLVMILAFGITITSRAQIESGTEYTITHIEEDVYFGTLSAGTYKVGAGFGYTNANAVFVFENLGGDVYKIKAKNSGRYLRASNGEKTISAREQKDDDYAKFRITKKGNEMYEIQVVANDWYWRYDGVRKELKVRKTSYNKDFFIISKYKKPSDQKQGETLKSEVKLRNLALGQYLAYDVFKSGMGPIKMGGYFEEYAAWKVLSYPSGKVSFVISGDPILAKGEKGNFMVSRGDMSVGAPDAMWKLVKVDNGVLIRHVTTNAFLSTDAEGEITLTTIMEDPRAVWQLEQKEVRMESVPKNTQEVMFATFLNDAEHIGFSAFEHSNLIAAQKLLNGVYSNWKLIKTDSGLFKLLNLGNNQYLSIVPWGDGQQLRLTQDLGNASHWTIKKLGIGGFELKNEETGNFIRTLNDGNTTVDSKVYGQWFFKPRKNITQEVLNMLNSK